MSAFTNLSLRSFRIPLSFQIVSSSMVAFLALPIEIIVYQIEVFKLLNGHENIDLDNVLKLIQVN